MELDHATTPSVKPFSITLQTFPLHSPQQTASAPQSSSPRPTLGTAPGSNHETHQSTLSPAIAVSTFAPLAVRSQLYPRHTTPEERPPRSPTASPPPSPLPGSATAQSSPTLSLSHTPGSSDRPLATAHPETSTPPH